MWQIFKTPEVFLHKCPNLVSNSEQFGKIAVARSVSKATSDRTPVLWSLCRIHQVLQMRKYGHINMKRFPTEGCCRGIRGCMLSLLGLFLSYWTKQPPECRCLKVFAFKIKVKTWSYFGHISVQISQGKEGPSEGKLSTSSSWNMNQSSF